MIDLILRKDDTLEHALNMYGVSKREFTRHVDLTRNEVQALFKFEQTDNVKKVLLETIKDISILLHGEEFVKEIEEKAHSLK